MGVHVWYVVAGALLIGMALMTTHLNRVPLTSAVVYLLIGVGLGPWGLGVMTPPFMEHVAEVAVLISLFTTGLKLRSPFRDARWRLPLRLATVAMVVTILMVTAVATFLLVLPAHDGMVRGPGRGLALLYDVCADTRTERWCGRSRGRHHLHAGDGLHHTPWHHGDTADDTL